MRSLVSWFRSSLALCGLIAATAAQTAADAGYSPEQLAALRTWFGKRSTPAQVDSFYAYRTPFFEALKTRTGGTALERVLNTLEPELETFGTPAPTMVSPSKRATLLDQAGAWRLAGNNLGDLLPWLLAALKGGEQDLRLQFALCEALGNAPGFDLAAAKAHGGSVVRAFEGKLDPAVVEALKGLVPELRSYEAGKEKEFAKLLGQVLADTLGADQPMPPRALRVARQRELEARFEQYVRGGDNDGAQKALGCLVLLDPNDLAAKLVIAMLRGSKGAGVNTLLKGSAKELARDFDAAFRALNQPEKLAVEARLGRLGFAVLGEGASIAAVVTTLTTMKSDEVAFFPNENRLKQALDSATSALKDKQRQLRDHQRELTVDQQELKDIRDKPARDPDDQASKSEKIRRKQGEIKSRQNNIASCQQALPKLEAAVQDATQLYKSTKARLAAFRLGD
jgi:hypothetical protein